MATFKKKSWKWLLILAGGLAVVAAGGVFDDPAPAGQIQAVIPDGYPGIPPAFSWDDLFRGPH